MRKQISFLAVSVVLLQTIGGIGFSQEKEKDGPKPPETIRLTTKDGVDLSVLYFPGAETKKTVPILLIHGDTGPMGRGSGKDCSTLASFLNAKGHAVFVPDLRGYGGSEYQTIPNGKRKRLDPARFRKRDLESMVTRDLEVVKKLIVEKHNAQLLNADLLCVVGFEMGTVIALNWTRLDWNIPSFPNLKQGKDVKGMVLVSPVQSYKGMQSGAALADQNVAREVSAMLIYGEQDRTASGYARKLYKKLAQLHRPIPESTSERKVKQDLFHQQIATSLQGTSLLGSEQLGIHEMVDQFVQLRMVAKRDLYPWKSRSR